MNLKTEAELPQLLSDYLLLDPRSVWCDRLISQVIREYRLRHDNRTIRLEGDQFTVGLIEKLLDTWGIIVDKDGLHKIHTNTPAQRVEDIPRVASYLVHSFLHNHPDLLSSSPNRFCGETAVMLFCGDLWPDFTVLKEFIENLLVHDWGKEHSTVMNGTAIELNSGLFAENESLKTADEEYPPIESSGCLLPADPRPRLEQMRDAAQGALMGGTLPLDFIRMPTRLRWYVYFDPDLPKTSNATLATTFPFEAIRQALEHVGWHLGLYGGDTSAPSGDVAATLNAVISSRWQQSHGTDALDHDQLCAIAPPPWAWTGWSRLVEMRDLKIQDEAEYDALMKRCHYALDFPEPDDVYQRWLEAREALGVGPRTDGLSQVRPHVSSDKMHMPPGTKWSDIRIALPSNPEKKHIVNIYFPGNEKPTPVSFFDLDMGHAIKKTTTVAWSSLREAVENDGLLPCVVGSEKEKNYLKKRKQVIKNKLCAAFAIEDDPFHKYRAKVGWRLKLKIVRPTYDQQAFEERDDHRPLSDLEGTDGRQETNSGKKVTKHRD